MRIDPDTKEVTLTEIEYHELINLKPEVDLDSVLTGFMNRYAYENGGEYPSAIDIARHFYELGLNTRKEG